ncbi:MAG: hypothetical protein SFV54_01260 [Bryobacteraceae bacterium]|nr:hypothetical protein [Bryobacteraceae bacterium]
MKFVLTALLALPLCAAPALDSREVTKVVNWKPDVPVVIEAERGTLEVMGWDQPKVDVYAKIEAETGMFRAKYAVEETQVLIDEVAGIRIRVDFSKIQQSSWQIFGGGSTRPKVHLKIKVPRSAPLRVKSTVATTTLADLRGEMEIESIRGSIKMSGIDGLVRLKTVVGDAELHLAKVTSGTRVETVRGNIQVFLPAKVKFDIEPDATRGEVRSDFGKTAGELIKERTKVNGGGPSLRVVTTRGTVEIKKQV